MSCGIDINGTRCATTFTNFHAYKRHLRKKHHEVISNTEVTEEKSDEEMDNSEDTGETVEVNCFDECGPSSPTRELSQIETEKDLNREVALWILKLKEGRKLTQSAVDDIRCHRIMYQCCDSSW